MKMQVSLEPGGRRTRSVEVHNGGNIALHVKTSVSDWTSTRQGGMAFCSAGTVQRSAAQWVRADLTEFTLLPKESRILRLSLELPDSASGSYWAVVFFEGEGAVDDTGVVLTSRARIGSTVYLTATGTEQRDDAITSMEAVPGTTPGTVGLLVSLANRGNVHYYPAGWLQVLGANGEPLYEESLPTRVLLPQTETVYRAAWTPSSGGEFRLLATFDLRQETLIQGVLTFSLPDTFRVSPLATKDPPSSPSSAGGSP